MVGVAVVAHEVLDFGWAEAFVLGAIVSPTDPVAATAIARRLDVPGRIVTIVEGESLINDGTALVAYKFAVAAVVTGSVQPARGGRRVRASACSAGSPSGSRVGAVIAFVRRRIDAPPVEITIALFSGYFAYLPAEEIGVSGVLAAVTVGIYMGRLHLGADHADDADPGPRRLGDRPVPAQLGAVRADRAAAPGDARRHRRDRHRRV